MLTGEISGLGFAGLIYFGSGPVIFGVFYFTCRRDALGHNKEEDKNRAGVRKVLLKTWDNRFDWWTFLVICIGGVGVCAIMIGVVLSLKVSRMAGLNIGIASAIWSFIPFFVAFLERLLYGVKIRLYQTVGMLFLVAMAILIALSDLFGDNPATVKLEPDSERTPAWHAVLVAFIYPLMASFMTLLNKYANVTLKVDSTDWVYAHTLAFSVVCTAIGAVHWGIARDF